MSWFARRSAISLQRRLSGHASLQLRQGGQSLVRRALRAIAEQVHGRAQVVCGHRGQGLEDVAVTVALPGGGQFVLHRLVRAAP